RINRTRGWPRWFLWGCRGGAGPRPKSGYDGNMPGPSRRLSLVRETVEVILRRLRQLSPSTQVNDISARVDECRREAETWTRSVPNEEREQLMKRLLRLHVEVAKLEGPGHK